VSFIILKGQKIDDVVALAKGLIGPTDLAHGGALTPQRADKLISMIFGDNFLTKIQTVKMVRLERSVDAIDVASRQLVRVPQGLEPQDDQTTDASEHGAVLRALAVQLFPTLKLDFLRANKDNPKLLSALEKAFVTRLQGDLVDLGFNGINDDGGGANQAEKFLRLNKGWLQIALEAAGSPKVDIDPATDGWKATLAAIMDAGDERWRENSAFVMNLADADDYARELGAHVTGTPLTADSPLRRFEGRPIEAHPRMPRGKVMFTPLMNLAHGVHSDIHQDKEYHKRKRVLEYTFDMSVDYEIAVKEACVLGKPPA
jgi:hypothetical protein